MPGGSFVCVGSRLGIVGKPFDVTGDVAIEARWNSGRLGFAMKRPGTDP